MAQNTKTLTHINIYGAIGYVILNKYNQKTDKMYQVIIFSDKHDKINKCPQGENYVDINKIFELMINTNSETEVLLEEVVRNKKTENIELMWVDGEHTINLRDLYIKNQDEIIGIDIRPHLIDFSLKNLSILISAYNDKKKDKEIYTLKKYLELIDLFFSLKFVMVQKKLGEIYTKDFLSNHELGKHFMDIKKYYFDFLNENKEILDLEIIYVLVKNNITNKLDNLLSYIIEWLMCALIIKYNLEDDDPHVIHTGLAHSEKVVDHLCKRYGYSSVAHSGIINLSESLGDDSKISGCIKFPIKYFDLFFKKK